MSSLIISSPPGASRRKSEPVGHTVTPPRAETTLRSFAKTATAERTATGLTKQGTTVKVSKNDLLIVTTQLAIMCRSGVDLAAALTSIARECRQPGLQRVLTDVSNDVNNGTPASVALGKHPAAFGPAYVASTAAAEASGTLVEVLQRMCELLKNEIRMQQVIRGIVTYPLVLASVASVVLNALVFFVLPQFSKVFKNMGRPAPPTTQFLLDGATFLRSNVLWILAAVAIAGTAAISFAMSDSGRRYWHRLVFQIPVLRDAMRSLLSGRVFRLMGDLLESGVPLVEALKLSRSAVKNMLLQELLESVENEVVNGRGMSGEISRSELIPAGAAQMIVTAERTGRLGNVLQLIGEHYEEQGEQQLRQAARVVEPGIIVVMGIAVGAVVMAIMLPLLDVSTVS